VAGSWVGLGKPSADEARALAMKAMTSVEARALGAGREHPQATADARAEAKALAQAEGQDDARSGAPAPLPRTDFGDVPSLRPWPELNAEASIDKAWMVAEGPVYKAGTGRRIVTLTFDDGPFPETTPLALELLARRKVHATFFVIGRYLDGDTARAQASRETLMKVAAAGHLIGNHSHDHVPLTSVSHTQVLEQIDQGAASIERVTGKRPILFRPPYGKLDEFGQNAVRERGLDLLLWSVEKQDMRRTDSHQLLRELVGQIAYKEGGIVLLHDIRRTSIAVLRELLDWLHVHRWDPKRPSRYGYEIVDLPTYLREVAAAPQPYARRDDLEAAREATAATQPVRPTRPATVSRRHAHTRAAGPDTGH
jgi:peptidoglycan-N-acetylglucosamine deacetylase